jgi:hypothetical protein
MWIITNIFVNINNLININNSINMDNNKYFGKY